jgi:hypothetical protein
MVCSSDPTPTNHPQMTIDMKSLAREGAKARLWQLESETNELLRHFQICARCSTVTQRRGTVPVAGAE